MTNKELKNQISELKSRIARKKAKKQSIPHVLNIRLTELRTLSLKNGL